MAITAGKNDSDEGFSSINVTPLTDVLLVLLIIFLITGSDITAPSHEIALPDVVTKEKVEDVNIVIDVTPKNEIYVGQEMINEQDKLETYLKKLKNQKQTDKVIINADKKTKYQYVMIAMAASRHAGLTDIALATEFDEEAAKAAGAKPKVEVGK